MKNVTVKNTVKVATIAGASILILGSAMSLTKTTSLRTAIMPVIAILVGVAAFNYAMNDKQQGSDGLIVKS